MSGSLSALRMAAYRWTAERDTTGFRVMPTRIKSGIATPVQSRGVAHIVRASAAVTDGQQAVMAARWMCGIRCHNVQPLAEIGDYRLCQLCEVAAEYDIPGPVVYRAFDGDGDLLYVGMSTNVAGRIYSHRSTAIWWPLVRNFVAEPYASVIDAERAESVAIATEHPRYNKRGRTA